MVDFNTVVILVGIAVGALSIVVYIRFEVRGLKSDMDRMETRLKSDMSEIRADIRVLDSRLRRVEAVINVVRGIFVRGREDLQTVFDEIDKAEEEATDATGSSGD